MMIPEMFDLTGEVALVTGGSKGLGKAMARGFAEAGANIVISSRHEDELQAAQKEIQAGTKIKVAYRVADMNDREEVKALAKFALDTFGRVDILVTNAGGNTPQTIDAITDEVWDRVVELNLTSCMALTRALVPQMKERKWGRIIHISSIMGLASKTGRNVYSATKSALIGLARASSLDLGEFGITVNCICPGPFLTDLPGIGSVCSGGRYDDLTGRYTKQVLPGVGASLGLDRLLAAMDQLGLLDASVSTPAPVLVTRFGPDHLGDYQRVARALRAAGIGVEVYPDAKKLGQQLQYAERKGFRVALIAGADEFAAQSWKVKNLATRDECTVPDAEVVAAVSAALG